MNYKKLIAGVLAVSLMGGGAIMPGETIKTLSDSMVMTASAAGTNYSCDSFDFDASTGTMTLKGNVSVALIRHFTQKENVKSVTAQKGTVFPSDCSDMFYEYSNVTSFDLSNVDTSNMTEMTYMFNGCSNLGTVYVNSSNTRAIKTAVRDSELAVYSILFINSAIDNSCESFDFDAETGIMTLRGNVNADQIKDFSKRENVKSITAEEGTVLSGDCSGLFFRYRNTESINLANVDTSSVTDMSGMFYACNSLTSLDVSRFDTSNVTNMKYMFATCSFTTIDVSSFDTSKVTDMSYMFVNCYNLSWLNLKNFNTSNVTDMSSMFSMPILGSESKLWLIDISSFDTSNVTDMSDMFLNCSTLQSIDLYNFDTSKVTNMSRMFYSCESLVQVNGTGGFDTSKVTDMSGMFSGCSQIWTLNVLSFDTSNVTDMSEMFSDCILLKNLDLGNFDTSKVTDMTRMFNSCQNLKVLDLSGFKIGKINIDRMFYECKYLSEIYCSEETFDRFWVRSSYYSSTVSGIDTSYNKVERLSDDSLDLMEDEFALSRDDINLSLQKNLIFGKKLLDFTEIRDIKGRIGAYYNDPPHHSLSSRSTVAFAAVNVNHKIHFADSDCTGCFKNLTNLETIDFSGLDTSNITVMANMFEGCTNLKNINFTDCDFSNVTDMSNLFKDCTSLKSISFKGCDLSSVKTVSYMFSGCTSLENVDFSDCDLSNVTDMSNMFSGCTALERIDMSMLNTSNVQYFQKMFSTCTSLKEVKLSGLITSSATNISMMFANCSSLKKVDLSNSDITNCTSFAHMFKNAPVEEIACTQAEYNTYVKNGSLNASAARVDALSTLDVRFQSTSMTLGGSISLNFYSELKGVSAENLSKTYAEFEVNGKKQTVKFNQNNMNAAKTRYGFTCMLNSVSMADDVKATLYYYDENGVKHSSTVTSNVQAYLKKAAGNATDSSKMVSLAKAINDYGYYMQKSLSVQNGWTIGTEHKGMETVYTAAATYQNNKSAYLSALAGHKVTKSVVSKDISGATLSLTLDSDTELNFKVTPAAGYTGKVTISIDGKAATATKLSDGKYQVIIPNIAAHQLGDIHTISINTTNGTSTYKVSALTYSYNTINSSSTSAEKYNAACALYEYYKAAMAYKG